MVGFPETKHFCRHKFFRMQGISTIKRRIVDLLARRQPWVSTAEKLIQKFISISFIVFGTIETTI